MARQRNPLYNHVWQKLVKQVLAHNDICWLCGRAGADSGDHVVPVSVDPTLAHVLSNIRPAHKQCNSARGNDTRAPKNPTSRRW